MFWTVLGPLTGSMLNQAGISVPVYGDLDHPLHASNIPRELRLIQEAHHDRFEIAIDASVGTEVEIGTIKVRRGPILPAKAVGKRLPAVGELAITGGGWGETESAYGSPPLPMVLWPMFIIWLAW